MSHYNVWVEQLDGTGRIVLMSGTDGQAASDLTAALVLAAQGVSFAVGITIEAQVPAPGPGPAPAPAPARTPARR